MTKERRLREGRTDKKGKEKLTGAQLELNRLKKKIATLKDEISLMPEKEQRIRDFFERNGKPVFDKETAMKYKFLVYLDESYESDEFTAREKEILFDLFAEESQGVEDYLTTDEQREHLLELKYKYDGLALGLTREELQQEAADDTLSMIVDVYGLRPTKAMKAAKTEEELLVILSDYYEARDRKELAAATGETPKRATRKKDAEKKKVSKRELEERLQLTQTLVSLRGIYEEMLDFLYEGAEGDETRCAQKEERLNLLNLAYVHKDIPGILRPQIEWIERVAMEAPAEDDTNLDAYNKILIDLLEYLDDQLYLIESAPLPGVEEPYSGLRNFAWKDLPLQMNMLFNRHKKDMKGIEQYVEGVSTLSGLKYFLKQYDKNRRGSGLYMDDDWGVN